MLPILTRLAGKCGDRITMALGRAFSDVNGEQHPLVAFRDAASDMVAPLADQATLDKRGDHDRSVQVLADSTGLEAFNALAGRRGTTGTAATIQTAMKEEAEAKAKVADAQLLALLAAIEDRIVELGEQIEAIDAQIEAIDGLLEIFASGEKVDPTDPAHMKLLDQAGVPKDEWGLVTEESLKDLRGNRVEHRTDAERQLDGLRELHGTVQVKIDAGTATPEDVKQYEKESEDFGVKSIKVYQEEGTELAAKGYDAALKVDVSAHDLTTKLGAI